MEGKIMKLLGKIFLLIGGLILLIWGIAVFFGSIDMPTPLKLAILFLGFGLLFLVLSISTRNKKATHGPSRSCDHIHEVHTVHRDDKR